MRELADLLERIDAYFESKSSTEKLAMILLPAILVGYIVWTIINPISANTHSRSIQIKKRVENKLINERKYLNSITRDGDRDYLVKEYDKKIAELDKHSDAYRKKIYILDKNLHKLSDMLFNKKSWSLFLDTIAQRANKNHVIVDKIENKYIDSNGSFGHVLEVGLKCRGSYLGIIGFMNDLEQNTLVTDIFSSSIHTEENTNLIRADLNISVWGINH